MLTADRLIRIKQTDCTFYHVKANAPNRGCEYEDRRAVTGETSCTGTPWRVSGGSAAVLRLSSWGFNITLTGSVMNGYGYLAALLVRTCSIIPEDNLAHMLDQAYVGTKAVTCTSHWDLPRSD